MSAYSQSSASVLLGYPKLGCTGRHYVSNTRFYAFDLVALTAATSVAAAAHLIVAPVVRIRSSGGSKGRGRMLLRMALRQLDGPPRNGDRTRLTHDWFWFRRNWRPAGPAGGERIVPVCSAIARAPIYG